MKKIDTKYIVAIIISLIIGASILGYGYMNYKYKKEALEQKIRTAEQAKIQIQNCLDEVKLRATNFSKETKISSFEELNYATDTFQKQKDECFKKYPQQ